MTIRKRVALVLLGAVALAGAIRRPLQAAPLSDDVHLRTVRACVQLSVILDPKRATHPDGDSIVMAGSGTLLTKGGLVLTNAHVVARPDGGSQGQMEQWDRWGWKPREYWNPRRIVAVGLAQNDQSFPQPTYVAQVVAIDFPHDMAILQIVGYMSDHRALMDGIRPQRGPPAAIPVAPVPLADSSTLRTGLSVHVFGYPVAGGDMINYTAGVISGFVDDDHDGKIDWIKTDALISGGNSGGTGVDDSGNLVGVPTMGSVGAVAMMGPSNYAKALLALVPSGSSAKAVPTPRPTPAPTPPTKPAPPPPAPSTGPERFGPLEFGTAIKDSKLVGAATRFPAGTLRIYGRTHFEGVRRGTPFTQRWLRNGEAALAQEQPWPFLETGDLHLDLHYNSAWIPGGRWALEVLLRGKVVVRGEFTVDAAASPSAPPEAPAIPAELPAVLVRGRVIDDATGGGIASAQVSLMRPGATLKDAGDALVGKVPMGTPDSPVIDRTVTNENGVFQFDDLVVPGSYAIAVGALGYQPALGNAEVTDGSKEITISLEEKH